jgi:putative urate catabolism protein
MPEPLPPRDLRGYGASPPDPAWPGGARLAVSFVLNFEEGGERSIEDGDGEAENYLVPDIVGLPRLEGMRVPFVEDAFEYGSRAGFWRILRLFAERDMRFTCWGVGLALARNPDCARAMAAAGHEVASHHWRWFDYASVPEAVEREHIARCVATITELAGAPPLGWYTGRYGPNSRRLVAELTGTIYESDCYNDDLPYWTKVAGRDRLIVPYALDTNDFKFAMNPGWMSGEDFFLYLRAAFDQLYAEGVRGAPRMMSVGLHARLSGRPGRAHALARFMDHVKAHRDVWVPTRAEIARHWIARFPAPG